MGKIVNIKVELGEFQFYCEECETVHDKSMYAIAQGAMGHDIVFTCDCGNKIDLPADEDLE